MRSWIARLPRGPLALSGLCLGLGALLVAEWTFWPSEPELGAARPSPVTAQRPQTAETSRFQMPPLTAFSEIGDRPLFLRSRRPPTETAAAGAGPANASAANTPFVLSGVVVVGGQRSAILLQSESGRTVSALEGAVVEGWRLESVEPETVVMRNGSTVAELTLIETLQSGAGRSALRRQPSAASKKNTQNARAPSLREAQAARRAQQERRPAGSRSADD